MRRLISVPLMIIGTVLISLGSLVWWANRQVFDTGQSVATATSTLAEPEVQQLLTRLLTDRIVDQLRNEQLREQVKAVVATRLADPAFQTSFATAVAQTHASAVDGAVPLITFNLQDVATQVRQQIVAAAPSLDQSLPQPDEALQFNLVKRSSLPGLWNTADRFRGVAPIIVLLGISVAGLALIVGPSRWALLVLLGVLLATLNLSGVAAVRRGLKATTGQVDDPITSAAIATISDPFIGSLSRQSMTLTVIGGVIALAGAVLGVVGVGRPTPQRGWTPPPSYRNTNWS